MRSPSSHDVAVSPVIGTILLVALTVVFIAIVAMVATGMAGGLFETKQVGVTLEPYGIAGDSERGVSVQIYGGADADDIQSLRVLVEGITVYYQSPSTPSVTNPIIGTPYRFQISNNDFEELKNRLTTVIAKFFDGTEAVVLQKTISLPQTQVLYAVMPVTSLGDRDTAGDPAPGHGVNVIILDPKIADKIQSYTVKMMVDGQTDPIELKKRPDGTFYIEPGKSKEQPYSDDPRDGELTGTLQIYATPKKGETLTNVNGKEETGNVLISQSVRTIEARKGIYEDIDVGYTLKATKKDDKGIYTLQSTGTSSEEKYDQLCYVVKKKDGSIINQYSYQKQSLNNNAIRWSESAKLDDYEQDTVLEVFVRKPITSPSVGNTFTWHKIYDTSIADLRKTLPTTP